MTDQLVIGTIFFLAAFVQGMTGFGSALVAIPLLCLIIEVKMAVPLCVLNGVILTTYMAYTLRKDLQWSKISPLLIGALPGIAVGILLLKQVNPEMLKVMIGVLLSSYSIYSLVFKLQPVNMPPIISYLVGFFSGSIAASLSAGGPPVIIYTTLTNWTKEEIKATLAGFFVINAYIVIVAQTFTGLVTRQVVDLFMVTAIFVIVGTVLGLKAAKKINRESYLKLVLAFLFLMGVMMIWG